MALNLNLSDANIQEIVISGKRLRIQRVILLVPFAMTMATVQRILQKQQLVTSSQPPQSVRNSDALFDSRPTTTNNKGGKGILWVEFCYTHSFS